MLIISHRGNLDGVNKSLENEPSQIEKALNLKYDVEIDLWKINGKLLLGHDKPLYEVSLKWLENFKEHLWIHCKNIEALNCVKNKFNAFGHNIDDYVLTSKNYIWVYPGKELVDNCITVLPENSNYNLKEISKSFGICTDFPIKFENSLS